MYARFPPFFGQPGPSCGVRRSGFFACPAPDTAVPVRTRRRVRTAAAVMAVVVALANQGGTAACLLCRGRKGYARGRDGLLANRDGPERPGQARPGRVSVCPAVGRQSDADTGVGRPESGGADECRVAFGRMPGLPGYAWVSQPNRAVGLPERGACCGYGRSAVLARKNEGSPERLPSPSKINP